MPIRDHVSGDHHPSAGVRGGGLLAVPKLRLSNIDGRLGDAVFVNQNALYAPTLCPLFNIRKSLVPIEVGVANQRVARPAHAQRVEKRKVEGIGPHGGKHQNDGQSQSKPTAGTRGAPSRTLQ